MLQSEVVSYLIEQIYRTRPDLVLSKRAIHKILFKVRTTLPEDDPVREKIPFYWYNYGPYSEVVESSIDVLKSSGVLRDEKGRKGSLLVYNHNRADPVHALDEASAIVGHIVRGIDPYDIGSFVSQIYRDDAPYQFIPLYKMEFLVLFKKYLVPPGQCTLASFSEGLPATQEFDRLEDVIYDCEASLIDEPLFEGFNDEFTSYVTGVGRAFDLIRYDGKSAHPIIRQTYSTAKEIWYTFAKGVRILDEGHDRYYDRKLREWEHQYRSSFSDLVPVIRKYNQDLRSSVVTSRHPNERSKRILSSLIEGYLS